MGLDLEPDVTVAAGWWLFFALTDGGRGERVELERGESARARLAAEARVEVEARIAAGGEDSIRLILALLVGAVFVYAGVLKVMNPLRFASDISNYARLPCSFGMRVAF